MIDTKYDVAISFAGEDREIAKEISYQLKQYGIKTFYDKDEVSNLLGENLFTTLAEIYSSARYCIVLISINYKSKAWTKHELSFIQARALQEPNAYLIPILLDETRIPGILPVVAHLKYPDNDAAYIANIICEKLKVKKIEENITVKKSKKFDMRAFQKKLETIYKDVNKNYSDEYIYGYLSRTLGYLCKSLIAKKAVEIDFIRPISWLFMLSSSLNIDLQEAFINRFPECCPHCLESKCICMRTNKEPKYHKTNLEMNLALEEARQTVINFAKVFDFDTAKKTISSIYPANEAIWHFGGAYFHVAKLYEEVSEIHEAMSKFAKLEKSHRAIADEIAEVLAWTLSAWDITNPDKQLNPEIISYYNKGCPVCLNIKCICKPNSNRFEGMVNREYLPKIQEKLKELRESGLSNPVVIDELVESLTVSIDSQRENLIIRSLTKIRLQLTYLESDISDENEFSHSLIRIIFEYVLRTTPRL